MAAADLLPSNSHATANICLLARLQKLSTATLNACTSSALMASLVVQWTALQFWVWSHWMEPFCLHMFSSCVWVFSLSPSTRQFFGELGTLNCLWNGFLSAVSASAWWCTGHLEKVITENGWSGFWIASLSSRLLLAKPYRWHRGAVVSRAPSVLC